MSDDVPYQPLHPNSLKFDRLVGSVVACVILVPMVVGVVIYVWLSGLQDPAVVAGLAVALVIVLLLCFAAWIYPAWAHRAASWRVSDTGLEIRQGVWWQHQIVIPHSRMQHSDIEQGPVQRHFDLATLVIHTAGTKDSSVKLDGLAIQTAEELRESLVSPAQAASVPAHADTLTAAQAESPDVSSASSVNSELVSPEAHPTEDPPTKTPTPESIGSEPPGTGDE